VTEVAVTPGEGAPVGAAVLGTVAFVVVGELAGLVDPQAVTNRATAVTTMTVRLRRSPTETV
jgi:hypothetical protein